MATFKVRFVRVMQVGEVIDIEVEADSAEQALSAAEAAPFPEGDYKEVWRHFENWEYSLTDEATGKKEAHDDR